MCYFGFVEDEFEDDEVVRDDTDDCLSDSSVAVAILENGTLAEYDVACEMGHNYFFTLVEFHHLGKGKIHSVDGVLVTDDNDTYNFFVKVKK